ncbi:hypothetical protein [Sorangium sp. So ce426]|uniref:hypothetical protein n=1 Tax=unclassified Sorangium TaxID=2621164 RepID=UPI003F5AE549
MAQNTVEAPVNPLSELSSATSTSATAVPAVALLGGAGALADPLGAPRVADAGNIDRRRRFPFSAQGQGSAAASGATAMLFAPRP